MDRDRVPQEEPPLRALGPALRLILAPGEHTVDQIIAVLRAHPSGVIALRGDRLVIRYTQITPQGCFWEDQTGKVDPWGFTCVEDSPPSDCVGGETLWEKEFPRVK